MSFRRGFIAAMVGVTAALLVGLSAASIASDVGGSTGPAIQTMGVSLGGIVGVAIAAATLALFGKRRPLGIALYGVGSVLGVGFLIWAGGRVPARPTLVLSASDRADLREYRDALGNEGIEHPTLGFRLRNPTLALATSTAIASEMSSRAAPGWAEAHQIWAFETRDESVSVVIDLSRTEHADREAMAAFDRAIVGPLDASGNDVERRPVTGDDGCLRAPFSARLTNGGRLDGALFAFDAGARAMRLVVTVVGPDAGDWARWVDDITLGCERLR